MDFKNKLSEIFESFKLVVAPIVYGIAIILLLYYVCNLFAINSDKNNTQQDNSAPVEDKVIYVKGDTVTETKTQIVYVPKETVTTIVKDNDSSQESSVLVKEQTDEELNIGKTDFDIKVNGNDYTFNKTDEEKYMFEDNKLLLEQTSKVSIDIIVEPIKIDETKHFGVGIGVNNDGKPSALITTPIKKDNVDLWFYGDSDTKSGGLMIRF